MPGSVPNASPATVMPWGLYKLFTPARELAVLINEYKNGESQRGRLVDTSRKRWTLARRLTPSELATLRAYYSDRKGPVEPFFVYDPWETSPKFSYDPTGVEVIGRYCVRFEGAWNQECGIGQADAQFALIQLA